jgi:hypothetical protein
MGITTDVTNIRTPPKQKLHIIPRYRIRLEKLIVAQLRFQVLTAVSMTMAVFWVIAPCSLVELPHRPDGGGSKDLWNVGKLLLDYTAQQTRRQSLSCSRHFRLLWNLKFHQTASNSPPVDPLWALGLYHILNGLSIYHAFYITSWWHWGLKVVTHETSAQKSDMVRIPWHIFVHYSTVSILYTVSKRNIERVKLFIFNCVFKTK